MLADPHPVWLFAGSSGVSSDSSANHEVSADEADVWSEEREALQAIYGEDMQILGPSQTLLSVDVHGTHFFLDFRIHHHLHYPSQPPLIGVRYIISLPRP